MWGRDFQPKTHEEVRKKAEEDGYQPPVDVFLPVCKEPTYLLANTWTYVRELNYPNYTVHVLDDGACDDVKELAEEFGFNCEFFGCRRRFLRKRVIFIPPS